MRADEAIARISRVLAALSQSFDKEAVREVKSLLDEKHKHYVEQGLAANDKTLVMHGIVGALSHYEAEKEKESKEKTIHSLTQDP